MTNFKQLAEEVLDGKELTNEEAMQILNTPDEELLELLTRGLYHPSSLLRE